MTAGDRFVNLAGARLRVREDGAGPAVLLIHGWALDLDMWGPQIPVLAARHRAVRYDRRGFGLSSGTPSVTEDVSDLERLMDRLRIRRAAVVGMSQGARVALRAALATPGRIACIVLDGAPDEVGATPVADEVPMGEYEWLAAHEGMDAVRHAWSRHPFAQLRTGDPHTRALLAAVIARYPGRDLLSSRADVIAVLARQLEAVSVPALVINGEEDSASRLASGVHLASAIPGARRVLVPGAGHLANLDNPAPYNAALDQFLTETLHEEH